MSTRRYGVAVLGNIAACSVLSMHRPPLEGELEQVAEALALISQANTRAYLANYAGETAQEITAQEIIDAATAPRCVPELKKAARDVMLFQYNCQYDHDFLEEIPGAYSALAFVSGHLLGVSMAFAEFAADTTVQG